MKLHNNKGEKLEIYYQKFLEKYLNAKHLKLDCGITDITTSEMHVEIKNWRTWKHALGQLVVYKQREWRPKLYAVFFGTITEKTKKIAIEVFTSKGIGLYELIDENEKIDINILVEADDEMDIDT